MKGYNKFNMILFHFFFLLFKHSIVSTVKRAKAYEARILRNQKTNKKDIKIQKENNALI